ncbi:phenazine-specific anthranilate synthase component I [Virgisporangium aliadipatigenens]|uniref:anthranilate synthase n=1 Tax=Virgisporangium aliadipatigenens TaxID=741659 RepID=A0A8J3YT32_9ACTN|nr:anthranilate synthase family protein [Virgisporangium aliadipatigenens]GIJ49972.1 phenazine-specific anthranilate synthase component I [Virgisporangium aliadipatigenens]
MSFTPPPGPFALLRRSHGVEFITGTVSTVDRLADIPLPSLAVIPYRQVAERGFDHVDDGVPLECLRVESHTTLDPALFPPLDPPSLSDGRFDLDDATYASTVEDVLRDEIGRGEGANFVIHRTYEADVLGDPVAAALAAFGRLLRDERGAYWTFLVHTGTRTLVGATPERHVSVDDGLVMMNPISGTYRHPAGGPDAEGLRAFLADPKEAEELYMVLDEELKMMAAVAEGGGQVVGPYLKPMAHLHHTEYLLAGRTTLDVRDVLRETMFAPTVVGSPVENACRVIARHERRGRRYYAGVLALLGLDEAGRQTLDAPILIRTAEISAAGRLRIPVGATLVRHSTTAGEVAETRAKAAGILAAFGRGSGVSTVEGSFERIDPDLTTLPGIAEVLAARNEHLARFWLDQRPAAAPPHLGTALVIDAEDTFTGMLALQLRALGLTVTVRPYDTADSGGYDLVVFGPGPGDPRSTVDERIVRLRALLKERLDAGLPTLGVCLGHQLLCGLRGLELVRRDDTYQGLQREIDFFGRPERVGFYASFTALDCGNEVHAIRGPGYAGVQFHPESVLSEHGLDLLRELVTGLLVRQSA